MGTETAYQVARVRSAEASVARTQTARKGIAVFAIAFITLAGLLLTLSSIGGLGEWSAWQFAGLFGTLELGSGIGNIIAPNFWRLPVTHGWSRRRKPVTRNEITMPHWSAAGRIAAGAVILVAAGAHVGVAAESALLMPLTLSVGLIVLALSALVARVAIARPDIDVVQLVVRRIGRGLELPPLSLGASFLQLALTVIAVPLVRSLPPSSLYSESLDPAPETLGGAILTSVLLSLAASVAWRGKII